MKEYVAQALFRLRKYSCKPQTETPFSQSAVSKWERGRYSPQLSKLVQHVESFGAEMQIVILKDGHEFARITKDGVDYGQS